MRVGYPSVLGIPGTGLATSVAQRVTNVSAAPEGLFRARDADTNSDGQDDTVFLVFGLGTAEWPAGNFARIAFDCALGESVRPTDLVCTFDSASDIGSNPIDPTSLVCRPALLEAIP
jgi:hypothetical protein